MAEKSLFNESMKVRDPSQQKRKRARTVLDKEAEFKMKGGQESVACTLTDVGTGGLSFVTKAGLYQGDLITISFQLVKRKIHIPCKVVRVSGKAVGAEYDGVSEEDLADIQEYIHSAFFEKDRKKT
ncbi:MAG: PilZ domain-containing protein [Spirochaetia bacterium]|nr:PilZ domain-containing protein [Spirochaetia bacterium]